MRPEVKHLDYTHPNALAAHLEDSSHDVVFQAVRQYVPVGARVLDAGSGRGELLERLSESGYLVTGCDMDDRCVELGSAYGEVRKLAVEEQCVEKRALPRFCRSVTAVTRPGS